MFKKALIMLALVAGFAVADTQDANAWVVRPIAPVRRIVAPPYPVARRVVAGPVIYRRPVVYGFRGPVVYGPVVSGGVFVGFSPRFLGWNQLTQDSTHLLATPLAGVFLLASLALPAVRFRRILNLALASIR